MNISPYIHATFFLYPIEFLYILSLIRPPGDSHSTRLAKFIKSSLNRRICTFRSFRMRDRDVRFIISSVLNARIIHCLLAIAGRILVEKMINEGKCGRVLSSVFRLRICLGPTKKLSRQLKASYRVLLKNCIISRALTALLAVRQVMTAQY